jgi:hypothetical protein
MRGVVSRWHRASALLFVTALALAGAASAGGEGNAATGGELEKLAGCYNIEVVTADPALPVKTWHGTIDGRRADKKALQEYAGLFVPEFSLYPADLVKRARLRRVVLCRHLSFAGQRRNAVPDYEHDTLYLDVSRGTHSKAYLRKVIHHEFFHIIDYRDDGSVYRDERWASLNPPGFKYGRGGRAAQDLRETSVLTSRYAGFLNHYSTTAVEEDKAEVFANLVVDPAYVEGRAQKDRVLKAKTERMKELLAAFCPEMNGRFWEKVRGMKRAGE